MKINSTNINDKRIWFLSLEIVTFLALFIPVYQSYNDQSPQIYIYCLSAGAMGIIGIWNSIRHQILSLRITIPILVIIALIIYVVVYQLMPGQYFDLQITARIFSGATIFFFFQSLRNQKGKIYLLFDVFIFYGIIEVIVVLLEVFKIYSLYPHSIHSINGTFGNPNVVAILLALLVPISFFQYKEALRAKYAFLFSVLLFIAIVILCRCRSAIVFLIFLISVYTLKSFFKLDLRKRILITTIIIGLFFALSYIWTQKKDSNISRGLIWKVSWEMIKEKPLSGYGFTRFDKEYNLHQSLFLKKSDVTFKQIYTTGYIRQPYNEFLYCWLSGGIFYLFIYLSFFASSIYYLVESFKDENNPLLFTSAVSISGLFLISFFSYTFYVTAIELFLFLHLGIMAGYASPLKTIIIKRKSYLFLLVSTTLFIGIYSGKQLASDYQISKIIKAPNSSPEKQIKIFEKYCSSNLMDPQFLYNYALALMKARRFKEAITKLELAKQYSSYYQIYFVAGVCYDLVKETTQAEKNYLTASTLCPSMFRPHYALFRLYVRQNNIKKARAIALKIDKMPVKTNLPEIEKIKNETNTFLNTLNIKQ